MGGTFLGEECGLKARGGVAIATCSGTHRLRVRTTVAIRIICEVNLSAGTVTQAQITDPEILTGQRTRIFAVQEPVAILVTNVRKTASTCAREYLGRICKALVVTIRDGVTV